MGRNLIWAFTALLICSNGLARKTRTVPVTISGCRVVSSTELHQVVARAATRRTSCKRLARTARRRIERYLHRRGYRLARVHAECEGGRLHLQISEGRLQKVLFKGTGAFTSVIYKLSIDLPHKVYHEPTLTRELRQLRKAYGLRRVKGRLVQVEDAAGKSGWELHIHIQGGSGRGVGYGIEADSSYGLVPRVSYEGGDLLWKEDRWWVSAEVGAHVKRSLVDNEYDFVWTYGHLDAAFHFPPFLRKVLEPTLRLNLDVSYFQRSDLPIDRYYFLRAGALAELGFRIHPQLVLTTGGGLEGRKLFGIIAVPNQPTGVTPFDRVYGVASAGARWVMNPDEVRRDRIKQLTLQMKTWIHADAGSAYQVLLKWFSLLPFGYNDFIWYVKGMWIFGEPGFYDERALGGRTMRCFFGGKYYVRQAAWFALDLRIALHRDVWKVSLFNDFAVFGHLTRTPASLDPETSVKVAEAFGPGLHVLLLDEIQLDLQYAFGFGPDGFFHNPYLKVKKVF